MRALGMDPGSSSFDLCLVEDNDQTPGFEASLPTAEVARAPEVLLEAVKEARAEVMVGPSAMGLPVTHVARVDAWSLAQMTLGKNTEVDIAIRRFIQMLQDGQYPAYFVPGVIQLPTVPAYRKRNRVDMGTADKTAIAALAIWEEAGRTGREYGETSLLVAELGFGFNALVAVENGEIIDGLGGSSFPGPGYLCGGALDAELAHVFDDLDEGHLGRGGIGYAGEEVLAPETLAGRLDQEPVASAWLSLEEGLAKAVAMELTVFSSPPGAIVLSGRLAREERLFRRLQVRLEQFGLPVRRLQGLPGTSKAAAQGGALLASGLAGGRYSGLVQALRLCEAGGTALDHIQWPGFNPQAALARKLQLMQR